MAVTSLEAGRAGAELTNFLSFWGKARSQAGAHIRWHPVAYHLLDVAAVAKAILRARPLAAERGCALLGLQPENLEQVIVALSGLHDLGKFAPAFQKKAPEQWPTSVLGPLDSGSIADGHHTTDGLVLWHDYLRSETVRRLWPGAHQALNILAPAVFGHHGRPVGGGLARPSALQRFVYRPARDAALRCALDCADAVLSLLSSTPLVEDPPSEDQAQRASWWLSGLLTTADWIGSSETWFRYTAPIAHDRTLEEYWRRTQDHAAAAVRGAGLIAPIPAQLHSFERLTGLTPTPMQAAAAALNLGGGPVLVLIEDVTGAGKTEASQMLVHRCVADGRAMGAYWAMPTQATANAMYERQSHSLTALFERNAEIGPSLVLAHGQQHLHDKFQTSIFRGASNPKGREEIGEPDELPGTVACTAWLADDRRRAMLADIGVGTIDQALLSILPSKFNTVRLFGLLNKVLIVDEAHAYDAYMGVELAELLRFHAALGGSAVVLSATLPRKRRNELASAWVDGLAGGQRRLGRQAVVHSADYPLITVVTPDHVVEHPVVAAPRCRRTVGVRFVRELGGAIEHLCAAVRAGGAVTWIRNTVDDCLAGAEMLRAHGVEPLVFHARFAQSDRQRREKEVLDLFGPEAPIADRRGKVLVATQVIEQSLDLDFDAMVSDLAPIDLLVQRAGRLWRHEHRNPRPRNLERELVVLSPPPDDNPPPGWLGGLFDGTRRVYEDAGILWRTVQTLDRVRAITTPEGLRDLIESVYGVDAIEPPESLLAVSERAEGKERGNAATATYSTLKVSDGYDGSKHAWLNELRVPTRIGQQQTVVRLSRVQPDGHLLPWAQGESPRWKAWALSEIRLLASRVPDDVRAEPRFGQAVARARAAWGEFEQEIPIVPMEHAGDGGWRAMLVHPDRAKPICIRYTQGEGLAYETPAV